MKIFAKGTKEKTSNVVSSNAEDELSSYEFISI
jgi:hypothetical protein